MKTHNRRTWFFFWVILVFSFWFFPPFTFPLPRENKEDRATKASPTSGQTPARFDPLVFDDDERMLNRTNGLSPGFRYLGPIPFTPAASPYVDVRIGIPETPGGNNHMRRQVALSPTGAVHMVYGKISGTPGAWTPADSATNFFYYYNAFNCNNSGDLLIEPANPNRLGLALTAPGPPDDPRPRYTNLGGLFLQPGVNVPVIYGRQYILNTNTASAGDVVVRGNMTFRDSSECLGNFSMDTVMTGGGGSAVSSRLHPVAYPLNESVWVATYRSGNSPSAIDFNYTTDRGETWSTLQTLPTYSPWFNSTDITGSGNTFYIVSTPTRTTRLPSSPPNAPAI